MFVRTSGCLSSRLYTTREIHCLWYRFHGSALNSRFTVSCLFVSVETYTLVLRVMFLLMQRLPAASSANRYVGCYVILMPVQR